MEWFLYDKDFRNKKVKGILRNFPLNLELVVAFVIDLRILKCLLSHLTNTSTSGLHYNFAPLTLSITNLKTIYY